MNTLPTLKLGDTIGVMAPSSYVEQSDIKASIAVLERYGFKTCIHPQTYARENQSAGTVDEKLAALHELWARDDIHAIWAAGGGNRSLMLLDGLDFKLMANKPKPFIGFSDATAILNALYARASLPSIHGAIFKNLHKHSKADLDHLIGLLTGSTDVIDLGEAQARQTGETEGMLIGGNLSLFQYLPTILPALCHQPYILILEDCHEELSHIDRMLQFLKQSDVLTNAQGIIFGQFTDLSDQGRPFGYSLRDIITEALKDISIPVITDAPFGHGNIFTALPIGTRVQFHAGESGSYLQILPAKSA